MTMARVTITGGSDDLIEAVTVDKSGWGPGPWQSEPDHVAFEHAGLPCLIHRGPLGALCGYAAVPPGHPAHGKDYNDVDVDAHGGLTYASACQDGGSICHKPKPGEPDNVWWFGFDCAHGGDISPGYERPGHCSDGSSYKDIVYVRRQVECLAEQLAAMVKP
jgi:hypothetical protein